MKHSNKMTDTLFEENTYVPLWSYINNKKRKIGYAYLTKNGGICIKGDPLMDKNQLGRQLAKGVYLFATK